MPQAGKKHGSYHEIDDIFRRHVIHRLKELGWSRRELIRRLRRLNPPVEVTPKSINTMLILEEPQEGEPTTRSREPQKTSRYALAVGEFLGVPLPLQRKEEVKMAVDHLILLKTYNAESYNRALAMLRDAAIAAGLIPPPRKK